MKLTPETLEQTALKYERWYGCRAGDGGTADMLRAGAAAMEEAERLRARLAEGLKWCDLMDGPVSKSQFCNGQATAAQQIRAALQETRNDG